MRTPMEPDDYMEWKVEQTRLALAAPTPALPLPLEEAAATLPGIVTVVAVAGSAADAVPVLVEGHVAHQPVNVTATLEEQKSSYLY